MLHGHIYYCLSAYARTLSHSHTHAYGGAAQLEVGYLTVSASWSSALHSNPCSHAAFTV